MPTPNPALNAIPGETAAQYEARLGRTNQESTTPAVGTGFGTPVSGFSTTPAPLPNGQQPAPIDPLSPSGIALKNSLEDTANAEGNNLSNVPTTNSTPPPDTSNFSLSDVIAKLGPAPAAPNYNTDQTNEENSLGVPGLQTGLQTANDNLTNLQNQIQQEQAGEASKPGVISSLINGRMQMISAESANALSQAKQAVSDATTKLNNANTAVNTFMKNDQSSYNDASAAYQKAYSNAIAAYKDVQDQEDKAQTSAKANAQVIINSYKGSSTGFNSIDDATKAQWGTLEAQAGLPPGTIEAAVKAELNITKFVKGADGSMYVTGTDANGIPYTAQVVGSQGSGSGSGGGTSSEAWTKQQLNSFTNTFDGQLDSIKGTDGYVSNTDYNAAKSNWIKLGGTSAAFDSAFKSYKSTNPQKS